MLSPGVGSIPTAPTNVFNNVALPPFAITSASRPRPKFQPRFDPRFRLLPLIARLVFGRWEAMAFGTSKPRSLDYRRSARVQLGRVGEGETAFGLPRNGNTEMSVPLAVGVSLKSLVTVWWRGLLWKGVRRSTSARVPLRRLAPPA